jgi:serine/threonine-protein kinase
VTSPEDTVSTTPSAPQPGTTLAGKYLVERVLGVGGMGVVVAARHLQLEQRVAIKYLLPEALRSPEVVARFAREARAAAKIRGAHVARVIDVGQFDDGAPFMVLEYLEGHDLAKHLELHGPLPVEDATRFLLETCEALAEAHAATIVHRDLKPSNLFLAEQPDKSAIIKVLDFGISKTGDAPSASLTKTSALMGTAFYMSPEQLTTPKGVDHRSDIWSLGVILYELLTGRPPFPGESVPEIVGAILTNQPEPLRALRADAPAGLEAVIAHCLQTKAADRYPSVAALAAAIGPFAAPKDRASVDVTARVLGEVVTAEPLGRGVSSTVVMPSATTTTREPAAQAPLPRADSAAPALAGSLDAAHSAPAGALTAQGLSTSSITPRSKRGSAVWIAAVAAVVVGGAGAGLTLTRSKGPGQGPPAAGIVAAPPTDTKQAATTTASATGAPTAATLSPREPSASASVAAPAAAPVGAPRVTPGTRAAPATTMTPAVATAAPATTTTPAVASAAPPLAPATPSVASAKPAPAASKNPLQMGIK